MRSLEVPAEAASNLGHPNAFLQLLPAHSHSMHVPCCSMSFMPLWASIKC